MNKTSFHKPVLLKSTLELLQPQTGEAYLDLTAGMGGHAQAIISQTKSPSGAVLVDRDLFAIRKLRQVFANEGVRIIHSDYLTAAQQLLADGSQFDLILLDLGVSSPQLDQAERGFSFNKTAPLDMRMNQNDSLTADQIVNYCSEAELAEIIHRYGEETVRVAQNIARAIVRQRPIQTTTELAELIEKTVGRHGRIHSATRTFQAIRIEVNQEIAQLEQVLPLLSKLMNHAGRLAIITFHSLEDRLVKNFLQHEFRQGLASELAPIGSPISGKIEQVSNPRSRSAMLRGAYKK